MMVTLRKRPGTRKKKVGGSESKRYRTLLEINNAIIMNLTQDDLLNAVFPALRRALPFDKLGLMLYAPEADELRFFALAGERSEHFGLGHMLDRHSSCFGEALDSGRPVLRTDLDQERRYDSDSRLHSDGFRSYCTVPMIVQGKPLGGLSVVSRNVGAYSEADAAFLQEVANQVALAIANMRSFEEIASLKARLQAENLNLQENAALMGRFAAALSHELNSPVGALKSAVQSTKVLAERRRGLSPETRLEAEEIEAQLHRAMTESVDRLHEVVARMQRFTNLDRHEILAVDLNALIRDVIDLLQAEFRSGVKLELDLQPLPRVVVRPQKMSLLFLNLLHNALKESSCSKNIRLASRGRDTDVEVVVQDDGVGLSAEELDRLFDPSFRTVGERIATGNWGLFTSRQIVQEHGGRLEIRSSPLQGTAAHVTLPRVAHG